MKTKNTKLLRKKNTRKKNIYYKNNSNGGAKIKLQKLNCSPKEKDEINEYSCYTNKSLYKLRDLWNARHSDNKITTNSPKEIHALLSEKLKSVCNKESCWLKQQMAFGQIKNNEIANSFAPKMPEEWKKKPNEWLSSEDIIKVMKQYEKAYKCFEFIGPTPIDFDKKQLYGECVWDELCKFSLEEQIKNKKTKIGVIFNTDPHDKPGQHWISLFINIKTRSIFFFDSVGDKPPQQIIKFVEKIKEQGLKLTPKIEFKYDSNENIQHQYGNSECGVYSLFFIVHMLEDKVTEHYLKTHILKDKYIEKFRKIYFNNSI